MNKKHILIIVIILIAASLAAFGRIAGDDFVNFDDNAYITANSHIQSGINLQSIQWAFTTSYFSYWHPLTWLSHMLDWSLFGANATGHHLVSLFLHIGAVVFLFLFLFKATNDLWPSAFAAAFFALHPLRVESVAWAAERKDVLSMFFGMATLWAYSFYVENLKPSKYILCLILFTLALMSKPMMVTLPFVLLLLDYWPLHRWQRAWDTPQANRTGETVKLIVEKIPFILLTVAASYLTFWAQKKGGIVASADLVPFLTRTANAIVSYTEYLWKIFVPIDLAVYYPYDFSLPMWKIIISLLVLTTITVAVCYYSKKLPFLFAGWFIYLGTLVPVIGLIQVGMQSMADRYTYLPSVGIAIGLTWGISSLIRSEGIRRKIAFPAAIGILLILSIVTWRQCGYWQNSITLFHQALRVTRNNDKMHNNLGVSYLKEGKISQAIYHYSRAIRIAPDNGSYYCNRGEVYARIGMYQQAFDDFNKAISLEPGYINAYYDRGITYDKTGQYRLALADFDKVIHLDNGYADAYNERGIIFAKLGQTAHAIEDFNKAISIKPDFIYAYANRAVSYFSQRRNDLGCLDALKACDLGNCSSLEAARNKGLCR